MGIARSISDLFGEVDVVEAAKLVEAIHIADPVIRSEIKKWIFAPLRLSIVEIAFVDTDEDPWPASFLIGFRPVATPWAVLRNSVLFLGDQPLGTIEHLGPPLPHEQRMRPLVAREASGVEFDPRQWPRARVRGPRATANHLLGKIVEAWPPGLRSKLKPPS